MILFLNSCSLSIENEFFFIFTKYQTPYFSVPDIISDIVQMKHALAINKKREERLLCLKNTN